MQRTVDCASPSIEPVLSHCITSRSLFAAAVFFLTVPLLTPCGTISIPLKIVRSVGEVISDSDPNQAASRQSRNAAADTPPLRIVRHAAISRSLLISDADATTGRRKKAQSTLGAAGGLVADTLLVAGSLVDPTLYTDFEPELAVEPMGPARPRRASLLVMTSPRVELRGYDIHSWKDKSAPQGIGRARANRGAKVLVQESGGHEYYLLASSIHYHAAQRCIILEGPLTLRGGSQTIQTQGGSLCRLDVATRTLYLAGTGTENTSPTHEPPKLGVPR